MLSGAFFAAYCNGRAMPLCYQQCDGFVSVSFPLRRGSQENLAPTLDNAAAEKVRWAARSHMHQPLSWIIFAELESRLASKNLQQVA